MLEKIEWEMAYTTGVIVIDNQHRELFSRYNSLVDAVNAGEAVEMRTFIESLEQYIFQHFTYEERMMRTLGYDQHESHVAEHQTFTEELKQLDKVYADAGTQTAAEKIGQFIANWLTHHILEVDMLYRDTLL